MQNPYPALTDEFNRAALRALLSSGQAVVAHRLAVMSKDGDWILREDAASLQHVRNVLANRRARYRFGAPLDERWLAGGWSSHLEFQGDAMRVRTDFVTRPPRISVPELAKMWHEAERTGDVVVGVVPLSALKLTNREKDYAVIGELARLMTDPRDQLRYSRSALDLMALARRHPDALADLVAVRPLLASIDKGRDELEADLDRERRTFIRANELRLERFKRAATGWSSIWQDVLRQIDGLSLGDAHEVVIRRATGVLPFTVPEEGTE